MALHSDSALANPRSVKAHEAALHAATDLLWEGGLPAATIDAISERSGVSKATLYKHWPNRTALAAEAFGRKAAEAIPAPDTGSARGDLTELVNRVGRFYMTQGGLIFAQMLAACVGQPESARYFDKFYLAARRKIADVVWQRAIRKGEVRADIDVETATQILLGPLIFRLLTDNLPISEKATAAIIDAVLGGLLR